MPSLNGRFSQLKRTLHPAERKRSPSGHSREDRPLHPPVDVDKGGNEEGIGKNPGGGVAEADGQIAPRRYSNDADQDTGNHLGYARKHGQVGEAGTLDGVAQDAEHAQYGEETYRYMEEHHSVRQNLDFGGIDKQPNKHARTRHEDTEGEDPIDHHHQRTGLHTLPDALGLARPVVLPGKGGHSDAQALEGTHEEHLDADGSRIGSHAGGAQRVVGTLEHDAADGGDGELESHGHTDGKHRAGQATVEAAFGRRGAENVEMAHHVEVAQDGRHALGHQRGNGSAGHTPAQHEDAEEVEHDVEHGGEEQEPERCLAVAQRTDDAGQEVVEEGAGDADEGNQQVVVGIGEDILGRADQVQDPVAEQGSNHRQRQGHERRQLEADRHITAHGYVVARTELLGHGDAEASATAVAETQNQENHRRAGTHRRQRIDAQKLSDDGSVDHRIGLLQQVAHQQGQCKIKDLRQGASLRHFHRLGHVNILLNSGAKLVKKETQAN